MELKASVIIQARCGSTRLPNKVLLKVLDKTILEYVLERVYYSKAVDKIIVATTDSPNDLKLAKLAQTMGVLVYRGSENDVLDRYYQAAKLYKVEHVVRITADCPLIDSKIVDSIIERYFKTNADYCSNTIEETFPDGEDVEVFSFSALKKAWEEANLVSEREHVTPYIRKHQEKFKLVSFKNQIDLSEKRWTLDREQDLEFIKIILEELYPKNPNFSMHDVLDFLSRNSHLEELNKNIIRNEGYLKSLKEDETMKKGEE